MKYACFERGNTSRFRGECLVYIAKMKRPRENCKGKGEENFSDRKGKNKEVEGKSKGNGATRNANLGFAEVKNDSP